MGKVDVAGVVGVSTHNMVNVDNGLTCVVICIARTTEACSRCSV